MNKFTSNYRFASLLSGMASRVASRYLVASNPGVMYPWELRKQIETMKRRLEPQLIKEGKDVSEGTISGGEGLFSVLTEKQYEFAQKYGWVNKGIHTTIYDITEKNNWLERSSHPAVLATLTEEGERVLKTPIKDLVITRPRLQGKLEDAAQALEKILAVEYDGAVVDRLEDVIYEGKDPIFSYNEIFYYKKLSKYYPSIITPRILEEYFSRPMWAEGFLGDLWDASPEMNVILFPRLRDFSEDYQVWLAYQVLYWNLEGDYYDRTAKIKRVLGKNIEYEMASFHLYSKEKFSEANIRRLQSDIIKHLSSDLANKVKRAIKQKDPKEKAERTDRTERTVVDSALKEKIDILDKVIARGNPQASEVAKNLKEIYLSGRRPSEDDLKAIRNTLYRSGMRPEADHFRMG
jgi:hypothetical protein